MAETRRDRVTLAALLAVLQERDRVFIVHRMGPHTGGPDPQTMDLGLRPTDRKPPGT